MDKGSIKERLKEKTIEAKKLQEDYAALMQEAINKGLNPEKIQREIADEIMSFQNRHKMGKV